MPNFRIVQITNRATGVADRELPPILEAIEKQVLDHFEPAWNQGCDLYPASLIDRVFPEHWQIVLLDDADQADALGYHELTQFGQPLGKVFVKTCQQYGENWTVTLSHELLEMLGDPDCDQTAIDTQANTYALEVCDAVEQQTYTIDGIEVSNFCFPRWFGMSNPPQLQSENFDYLGKCLQPFQLQAGGYISEKKGLDGSPWTDVYGAMGTRRPVLERHRHRLRFIPKHHRRRSRPV